MNLLGNWRLLSTFIFVLIIAALLFLLTIQTRQEAPQPTSRVGRASASPTERPIALSIPTQSSSEILPTATATVSPKPVPTGSPTVAQSTSPLLADDELGTILGMVVDEDGEPLHLADVELKKKTGAGFVAMSAASAQKGNFAFPNLQSATYQLIARCEGCMTTADSIQLIELQHREERVVITLPRSKYAIRGVVREKGSGKPIDGQKVVCVKEYKRPNHKNFRFPEDVVHQSVSNEEGNFVFPSVCPGTYLLTFDAIFSATSPYTVSNPNTVGYFASPPGRVVSLEDRDVDGVILEAASFPRVSGIVRNEAGERVRGATVSVNLFSYRDSDITVYTDSKGYYEFPITQLDTNGVSVGFDLHAYHPDCGGASVTIEGIEAGSVRENVDLVLRKGRGRIFGVVTVDGKPPAETVELRVQTNYRKIVRQLEGDRYEFEINEIVLGGETNVWASSENTHQVWRYVKLTEERPEARVDIDLKTSGNLTISGTVSDRNGNPLEDVRVIAKNWNIIQSNCRSNMKGEFELTGLESGEYDILCDLKSDRFLQGGLNGVEAGRDDVFITLDDSSYRIKGQVLYEDGRSLNAEVFVALYREGSYIVPMGYWETNKEDGSYSIDLYQSGRYTLYFQARSYIAKGEFTLSDDSEREMRVDLILHEYPNMLTLRGRYFEKEGVPVERFFFYLVGDSKNHFFPSMGGLGGNGYFHFVAEPGEYLLRFHSPFLPPYEIPITVEREIESFDDWAVVQGE